VAVLVLDNDAADVAFVDDLANLLGEIMPRHFELLVDLAQLVHVGSVPRYCT